MAAGRTRMSRTLSLQADADVDTTSALKLAAVSADQYALRPVQQNSALWQIYVLTVC